MLKLSKRLNEAGEPNEKKRAMQEITSTWKSTKDAMKSPDDIIDWYKENIKIAKEKL